MQTALHENLIFKFAAKTQIAYFNYYSQSARNISRHQLYEAASSFISKLQLNYPPVRNCHKQPQQKANHKFKICINKSLPQ
jgi:hypothetical protein